MMPDEPRLLWEQQVAEHEIQLEQILKIDGSNWFVYGHSKDISQGSWDEMTIHCRRPYYEGQNKDAGIEATGPKETAEIDAAISARTNGKSPVDAGGS